MALSFSLYPGKNLTPVAGKPARFDPAIFLKYGGGSTKGFVSHTFLLA